MLIFRHVLYSLLILSRSIILLYFLNKYFIFMKINFINLSSEYTILIFIKYNNFTLTCHDYKVDKIKYIYLFFILSTIT